MTEKDILPIILALADNVWKNWGILATITIAILGWLIQRHGLHSRSEKIISSVVYSIIILVVMYAMNYTYKKLDQATNELAYIYMEKPCSQYRVIVPGGIIDGFLHRSPKYCYLINKLRNNTECKSYSYDGGFALIIIFFCWILVVSSFWRDSIWKIESQK